jgi:hypothetical protein
MNKRNEDFAEEDRDNPFGSSFCLHEFKNWMDRQNQNEQSAPYISGMEVVSKVPYKKLISKMEPENGELHELARDFRKEGGIISEIDGVDLLIEVRSGTFTINKNYVKSS